jgi:hypothetical protein
MRDTIWLARIRRVAVDLRGVKRQRIAAYACSAITIFFERGIARAFAHAVHRAFNLARAALTTARDRIRDRETEIVVAVRGEDRPCLPSGTLAIKSAKTVADIPAGTNSRRCQGMLIVVAPALDCRFDRSGAG